MSEKTYTLQEVTAELVMAAAMMGTDLLPEMAQMFVKQLKELGAKGQEIINAARMVATEEEGRITVKKLLKRIPRLQYPDAEVAWATFPKEENQTAAVVEPALKAWGQAAPLWCDGDKIGARMAFKAAYEQFVSEAKQAGRLAPKWAMTFGSNPTEREEKVREAAACGLISIEQARQALPHLTDEELTTPALPAPKASFAQLEHAVNRADDNEVDKAQVKKWLSTIRATLENPEEVEA